MRTCVIVGAYFWEIIFPELDYDRNGLNLYRRHGASLGGNLHEQRLN